MILQDTGNPPQGNKEPRKVILFLHCSDTVGWKSGGASGKEWVLGAGCWSIDGDSLTGAYSSTTPSILAPIASRMETF